MSYWGLTRKMKAAAAKPKPVPTHRPQWQHWALWFAEALGITAASVGLVMALVRMPDSSPVPLADEAKAWEAALTLSHATAVERAEIPRPPTYRYPNVRVRPTEPSVCKDLKPGEQCMMRMCGMTEYFMTLDKAGALRATTITTVFLRPSEDALVGPILTHEYLHTIWLERAANDPLFYVQHPDSEAWVVTLVPVQCPVF